MGDYKYKTKGDPEPRKLKALKPQPDYYDIKYDTVDEESEEEEIFNLDMGTGFSYPGQWIESEAQRSVLDDEEDYY